MMRAGHRQSGGVRKCSWGIVFENYLVGSKYYGDVGTYAHRHFFEYPLGKPLEAKILKEFVS